jgi:hypothetical protein
MSRPRKPRDWRFELLRLIAMLLIVSNHYFAYDNWDVHTNPERSASWAASIHDSTMLLGQIGVTIFVLISAYFLANSRSSPTTRLIHLWIEVFIYSSGAYVIFCVVQLLSKRPLTPAGSVITWRNGFASFFPVTMGTYWFISAFFAVTVLGPFLNTLADSLSKKNLLIFTGILVWITFLWRIVNPKTVMYYTDVGYFSSLYLIGCIIKRYPEILPAIRVWKAGLIVAGSFLVSVCGTQVIKSSPKLITEFGYPPELLIAGPGASPIFAVIAGTAIFLCVAQYAQNKKPSSGRLCAAINMLAPATLGIYLLHENFIVKLFLWPAIFAGPEPSSALAKLLTSILTISILFLVLLALSLSIRTIVVRPVLKATDRVLSLARPHMAEHKKA